ncbi:hypothetical protein FB451DRAFT_1226753 [Mycena latifolia]|nr:hypothetical protein FB451DRAFT_1226753 [Mycena latifolia]
METYRYKENESRILTNAFVSTTLMILGFPVIALLLLPPLPVRVTAQGASPLWRKSNITTSTTDRIGLAAAALDSAIDRLGADGQFDGEAWGTTGNLFSQMAEFDIATNQMKYQSALEQYFELLQKNSGRTNFSDPLCNLARSFGHAAAKAYAAYKTPAFLQYAAESWWNGRARTLSDNDVLSGKIDGKNFSVAARCANATMAGGTFWDTEPKEPSVAGVATGLSALLAETTNDPLYLQAAVESADFIHSHLYNIGNIVQDYISAGAVNETECQVISSTAPTNSGLMIEGLAILASVTKNSSTQNLLSDLLVAVIPDTSWQGANGVITTPDGTGDMNLLQGLGAAYTRNLITPALRQYVGAYIAVQFNAVTDLATSSGTNIYGSAWTGPPSARFSGFNQTMALAALLSAMGVSSDSGTPSSSTMAPSGTPSSSSTKNHPKLGAILGGVLGGIAIISIAILVVFLLLEPFMAVTTDPIPVSSSPGLRHEKRRLDQHPTSTAAGMNGEGSGAMTSATGPPGPGLDHPDSSLPTEALVELLNRRLRNRQWDDGETPPDYPVTGVGSSR